MLNLENLRQLVAFADCGTLSAAAIKCNISQPTITRTMQALEDDFGAELFNRSKNRISLNATGRLAVEQARTVLASADSAYRIVRTFDRSRHTIRVKSCAPAPLWSLLPRLTELFPDKSLSSEIAGESDKIIDDLREGNCDIGVTLYIPDSDDLHAGKYMDEKLYICLPKKHELVRTKKTAVTFDDLNGYNCLLRTQLGFWSELVYRKMPASKFLVQSDDFAMDELIRTTSLPFFVTDISMKYHSLNTKDRNIVPIKDDEASVNFFLVAREKKYLANVAPQKKLTIHRSIG